MKKLLRKNIIGFIIGAILFGSIGITVASQILATQVSYTNEKSEANVTNVDGALTELYGLAEECQKASNSGSGVIYYGKDAVAVYLDPTGSATNCSDSNFTSTTETKSGCMRFWKYAEDGESYYAILDHNTTVSVSGFYEAQSQVKEDTASWNPNLQARNISAMEIYKITESTNNKPVWQINNRNNFYFNATNGDNGKNYGWLFDRTYDCLTHGCITKDNNTYNSKYIYGYWTSDINNSSKAWYVEYIGYLKNDSLDYTIYGVRPIIKIAKS